MFLRGWVTNILAYKLVHPLQERRTIQTHRKSKGVDSAQILWVHVQVFHQSSKSQGTNFEFDDVISRFYDSC